MKKIYLSLLLATFSSARLWSADPSSELPLPDKVDKTLILQYPKTQPESIRFENALQICESYRQLNNGDYFFVFCKFNRDEKDKDKPAYIKVPTWIRLGTEVSEQWGPWGHSRTESPQYGKSFELVEVKDIRIASLAVWGVGKAQNLKWKTLYPVSSVDGTDPDYAFSSKKDALLSCHLKYASLRQNPNKGMRFERAECLVTQNADDGEYHFVIRSKNPLIALESL